jgi:histone H3/H4
MAEGYVVKSKVKEFAKNSGMRFAGDAFESLDELVKNALEKAAERAKQNGRKTIRGFDI